MAPPKKLSIFAQRMKAQRHEIIPDEVSTSDQSSEIPCEPVTSNFGDQSYIVNSLDAETIHNENIEKLNSLSLDEINEERKRLLKELDPSLVEFLRAKREKVLSQVLSQSDQEPMEESPPSTSNSGENTELSAVPELANKFVHMDIIEEDKLKWLEDLPPLPPIPPDVPYTARFDFNGTLLPYKNDSDNDKTINAGLHHHGEEAQRPGYSIQELLQLSRSSVTQQRIVAVATIASILEKAEEYDGCFDTPLRVQLMNPELFLLIRFSLDDSIRSTVTTSLRAMCNLLVCHLDEFCFDRELGTFSDVRQPLLHIHDEDLRKEEKEIKDVDILKLDVVKGALRTDLLLRLRYILDKMQLESIEIVQVMKCLIRIVRHSYESTLHVIRCPYLLDSVCQILQLQPGPHTIEAIKFFRLIASHSRTLAYHLLETSTLIDNSLRFIAAEHTGNHQSIVTLICECFYFWQTFIRYGITIDRINSFSFVIHKLLIFHLNSTSITSSELDVSHCCSIFSVLESASSVNYHSVEQFVLTAVECCRKWLTQLISEKEVDWFFCKLCGVVIRFLAVYTKNSTVENVVKESIKKFISSQKFELLGHYLTKNSWLLKGSLRQCPENLFVLGIVPPTLQKHSVLPLFSSLAFFFLHNPYDWSSIFLKSETVLKYLKQIVQDTSIHKKCNCTYARHEIHFLVNCCKLFITAPVADLTEIYHELSLIVILCIQNDDRSDLSDLFKLMVFNPSLYNMGSLVAGSSQSSTDSEGSVLLQAGLQKLNLISDCYLRLLGLTSCKVNKGCQSSLFDSEKGLEPSLPTDWQYLPIMLLHGSQIKNENNSEVLDCTLFWIYILECTKPRIANRTSVTARFCRLCCVFLIENDIFRDFPILMDFILQKSLHYNDEMDFEKPVSGLTSFYDFYRELLEQLNGISYNDTTFSNFVLVPLQQRHSNRFRKLIWSEQATTIRFLGTSPDTYHLPLRNYLEPVETDESLLVSYLYFLATNKVRPTWSPLLYKIALHHVAMYVKLYPDNTCAKTLLGRIKALGNTELRSALLDYQSTTDELS